MEEAGAKGATGPSIPIEVKVVTKTGIRSKEEDPISKKRPSGAELRTAFEDFHVKKFIRAMI